jgi:Bacterial conjugation TrbI-like protein
MKSFLIAFAVAALCATGAAAQSVPPSENTSSEASLAGGTEINATLNSSIDSKKAKPGQQIAAHTVEPVKSTDGRTILPNGTKLIGHVTNASARSNGQGQSTLAIQFDKAMLKGGQEVSLNNVVIQAVAAPAREATNYGGYDAQPTTAPGSPSNNPSMSGSRGARPEGTPTQTYPGSNSGGTNANGTNPNSAGNSEANNSGPLPANARGVYGLNGVRLSASSNGEGTVLTSTDKNIHLDGGTRLLLTVQPQSASAAPSGK